MQVSTDTSYFQSLVKEGYGNDMEFIKPEELPIREAWAREDKDFTPWLSENLDYLSDLGLGDLTLLNTEVAIPGISRRLDILAETADGKRIAIENQFNSSDHDHLTRGLAYAVGLKATALIVIAEDHRPEFRAVAEYLNDSAEVLGEEGIHLFLVSVRVEKVGRFVLPRFEVLEEPNIWKIEVSDSDIGRELTEGDKRRRTSRMNFWKDYLEICRSGEKADLFTRSKPHYGNGIYMSTKLQGIRSFWGQKLLQNSAAPQLSFEENREVNDLIFNAIYSKKKEIEAELGMKLEWTHTKGASVSRITGPYTEDCGWATEEEVRRENIEQAIEGMDMFFKTINKYLRDAFDSIQLELEEEKL